MTAWITQLDVQILTWVQENLRGDVWTAIWRFITLFGDKGLFWIVLGLALLIPRKTRKVAAVALAALVLDFICTNLVLKNWIARVRPYDAFPQIIALVKESSFSFPSGHSAASLACSVVYLKLLPRKAGVPLFVLAILVALSRIYLCVHYPSDVVAGALIGAVCALIACWADRRFRLTERLP